MNWRETAGSMLMLAAIVGCGVATEEARLAAAESPLLEVRAAYNAPAPGLEMVEYDEQVLHVSTEPLVSDVDFTDVESVFREGRLIVSVQCTEEANQRFEAATRSHVGQPLVVLVGSQARSAPVVRTGVQCTSLQVALEASPEEAEHLVARINDRWPPQ